MKYNWYFKSIKTGKELNPIEANARIEEMAKEYREDETKWNKFVKKRLCYSPEYYEYYKNNIDEVFEMNELSPFWEEWSDDNRSKAEEEFEEGLECIDIE